MEHNKGTFSHPDGKSYGAEVSKELTNRGVFFQCPMINCLEILPLEEWPVKIEQYIEEQMKDDLRLQSMLLIKNCNSDQSKVDTCIETLLFYVENIIKYKNVETYRKIRLKSKIFIENILPIKGAIEFLNSIGFIKKKLIIENQEEEFLVLEDSLALVETSINYFKSTDRIKLVLDRNVRVLLPSTAFKQHLLPSEFFETLNKEIKMEHQKGDEELGSKITKTQNGKTIDQINISNTNFKYCIIQILFPDNLILQGTFDINETLSNVFDFIKESVFDEEQPFQLKLINSHIIKFEDQKKTLKELNLVPTATLLYTNDQSRDNKECPYLKFELLSLV